MFTIQLYLFQGGLMLHRVYLLYLLCSQGFQDHRQGLLLQHPIMVCASSVANLVTSPGTALYLRTNWLCRQLDVAMPVEATSPATTVLGLMVSIKETTLTSMKLKTSLLL
jgi:hypothetical protein